MRAAQVASIAELRHRLEQRRRDGAHIGFVPTMGALHQGHGRLIERAREACDTVLVSIFVNPLQFDRQDDLDRYPRSLPDDLALCDSLGADLVFVPSVADMYPEEPRCTVDVAELGDHLCGRYRPGHFRGVATVVLKLFQIVQPGTAYFGEKDAQQLAIVRRLVADLNVPVTICGVETVREPDGLAMSSRNRRLDADERALAPVLYAALSDAQAAIEGGLVSASAVQDRARKRIPDDDRLRLEYLETVDAATMQPVEQILAPVVVAGALWVGRTRLIDNVRCAPPVQP